MTDFERTAPGSYTFVVPAGVTSLLDFTVIGAKGGHRPGGGGQSSAGIVLADAITVTPGETLYIDIGGVGGDASGLLGGAGGFNGGGAGGQGSSGGGAGGGGGGGYTAIYRKVFAVKQIILLAAGGGGSTTGSVGGDGGASAGAHSATGDAGAGTNHGGGGVGGIPGGFGGAGGGNGTDGTQYHGGVGGNFSGSAQHGGGGGGGGYYGGGGGGGGATVNGGGGGGSSAVATTGITGESFAVGGRPDGNGYIDFSYNVPPNAPIIVSPAEGVSIRQDEALLVDWNFSDPDPSDFQTFADFRWRIGTGAYTTLTHVATTGTNATSAPGAWTFASGTVIGFQVRTTDADGAVGPWSAERHFTPRPAPADPTITPAPVLDSVTPLVRWTTPVGMTAYQVRVVNDVAGSPGSTVLVDTGKVTISGTPTTGSVTLPAHAYTPGVDYHFEIRYQQFNDVWSNWKDSGPITTTINAPLQPTLVTSPDSETASITVEITNPGSDPHPPTYNDVYRTNLDDGSPEIRIATAVELDGTVIDWTPASRTNYRYRVVAVTGTGAFTSSE